jgi:hypothetical protein
MKSENSLPSPKQLALVPNLSQQILTTSSHITSLNSILILYSRQWLVLTDSLLQSSISAQILFACLAIFIPVTRYDCEATAY